VCEISDYNEQLLSAHIRHGKLHKMLFQVKMREIYSVAEVNNNFNEISMLRHKKIMHIICHNVIYAIKVLKIKNIDNDVGAEFFNETCLLCKQNHKPIRQKSTIEHISLVKYCMRMYVVP
jgi:hypothetical protein